MPQGDGLKNTFVQQAGLSEARLMEIGTALIENSRAAAAGSDHHRYHVGSAIYLQEHGRTDAITVSANKIPARLKDAGYDTHTKLGEGHPTVHGEFPLLYDAPQVDHLFLGCNTPFCATCMKSAVLRGVDALFLDAKSLEQENEWTSDFSEYWHGLCLPIAQAAEIPIFSMDVDNGRLDTVLDGKPPAQRPMIETSARILKNGEIGEWKNHPGMFLTVTRGKRSAIGLAKDRTTGEEHFVYAEDCYPPGFNGTGSTMEQRYAEGHYRFPVDPILHMCMLAARNNLKLEDGKVIANFVPSSGRQLDLAHVGISHIMFTDNHIPPTAEAIEAMRELSRLGIIDYLQVRPNKELLTDIFRRGFINGPSLVRGSSVLSAPEYL